MQTIRTVDYSYPPGLGTVRTMDHSYSPRTFRTVNHSHPGPFVPPLDDSYHVGLRFTWLLCVIVQGLPEDGAPKKSRIMFGENEEKSDEDLPMLLELDDDEDDAGRLISKHTL